MALENGGFACADNRESSEILWVHDDGKWRLELNRR